MAYDNHKRIGELGECIAIGELAKFNIPVLKPLGDNLPYDFVVDYNHKFFKCQVKTSQTYSINNSTKFTITTNNWHRNTRHHYTANEVDVWVLCDMCNIYIFRYDEMPNTSMITLRDTPTKNGQKKNLWFKQDYVISEKRIEEVFK